MSVETKPVDWDFIVKTIKRQRSVLFLGPELFKISNGLKSKQQDFFEELANENPEKIFSYNQDGFFLFSSPQNKTRIFLKIVDFFEEQPDQDIVRKIAEIPFHTIVSINPDIALKKFFEQHNQPHTFEYFDKNNKKEISEPPSVTKPLIYNLFGSVTKEETLILTHHELFEYFKAIMGNNVLPLELRTVLESAHDYIFLGFQFDKWYVQLILSLLKLSDEKYQFIRYASSNVMNKDTASLCINHFKIEFIGDDGPLFIDTLHEKCVRAGIVRQFSTRGQAGNVISDLKNERVNDIARKIERQYKLLSDFEKKLDTEINPRLIMQYEDEIELVKKQILEYELELKSAFQFES